MSWGASTSSTSMVKRSDHPIGARTSRRARLLGVTEISTASSCPTRPVRRGQSRHHLRPLIDPFENRPHRLDSGVDDPPFVEMERCGFSGQRGDMIVGHGSTVV